MAWRVEITPEAKADLKRIGGTEARRILKFLFERLQNKTNPRETGKALVGPKLAGIWRYRVGHYRILCRIEDEKICVVVIKIGNRRDVYRR